MIQRHIRYISLFFFAFSQMVYAKHHRPDTLFTPFEAVYTVKWHGIPSGKALYRLKHLKHHQYVFDGHTTSFFAFLPYEYYESTNFVLNTHTPEPLDFHYQHTEKKKNKEGHILFDWKKHLIQSSKKGAPWPTPLRPGTHDKLTHTLMLRYDLKHHKAAKSYTYSVAEEGHVHRYHFSVLKKDVPLKTTLGTFKTILLQHISKKGYKTHIWFAKDLDYLPVRLLQYRQGKLHTEASIKQYSLQKQ